MMGAGSREIGWNDPMKLGTKRPPGPYHSMADAVSVMLFVTITNQTTIVPQSCPGTWYDCTKGHE